VLEELQESKRKQKKGFITGSSLDAVDKEF